MNRFCGSDFCDFLVRRLTCVLVFCCLCCSRVHSDEPSWPQWMGKNLDGISKESDWSTNWPVDGLQPKWSKQIGIGFSSMSIDKGRLYTMGHTDGVESILCFRCDNGEVIWKHSYPCKLVDVLYEGGPGSTPTVAGDHVYAVGKEGQLVCLNKTDGSPVWQVDLQKDLDLPLHEWGYNASPFILDDKVIVEVGRLAAYERGTGKPVWKSEKHTAGYGSVRTIKQNGRTFLVTLDCDGLRINDANDASEVAFESWKSPFRTNSTTPIVHQDTIFISTGYQVGCGLFRWNGDSLDEIYTNRKMRNHFNNSILYEGYLYGFDGNSNLGRVVHLTCMNHATGEVAWKHRGLGCGSLMIADGKLVILSDDGRLVIANASPEKYESLAETPILEGRCWTVPVLLDGHVFARSAKGTLVCVELPRE